VMDKLRVARVWLSTPAGGSRNAKDTST